MRRLRSELLRRRRRTPRGFGEHRFRPKLRSLRHWAAGLAEDPFHPFTLQVFYQRDNELVWYENIRNCMYKKQARR
jgi:hypothetical protein